MIPVKKFPEPVDFDKEVRIPGKNFLKKISHPKTEQWKNKEFWRIQAPEMRRLYKNVCSYCAQWISYPTGLVSIDHYMPKAIYPELAYEWDNFRLSCALVNSNKLNFEDVMDPFLVKQDMFCLDFDTYFIHPNNSLSNTDKENVKNTIERLKLNLNQAFVDARIEWIAGYKDEDYNFSYLERRAPFIAYELKRQGLA